ncbi:hypothetical protein [Sulfitobacter guttiformis]|uniref:hypothetical protein n=1 Tax=Sulfitobacter guttiformis TaxID=74349 RepID=UPI000467F42D|nr:hypothetical protein [Sulfitobacter guttiformis]KIN72667.1 hypothetical protein Z949_1845 [Sulfitobacter guttiformis KCTC 32187]
MLISVGALITAPKAASGGRPVTIYDAGAAPQYRINATTMQVTRKANRTGTPNMTMAAVQITKRRPAS